MALRGGFQGEDRNERFVRLGCIAVKIDKGGERAVEVRVVITDQIVEVAVLSRTRLLSILFIVAAGCTTTQRLDGADFVRTVEKGQEITVRLDRNKQYVYADCWVIPNKGAMPIHTHRFEIRVSDLNADQLRALQKHTQDQLNP